MEDAKRIEQLIHAKRNCAQMLHAVDRLLERAHDPLEQGNTMRGKGLVQAVRDSLPRAIAALEDQHEEMPPE